MSTVTTTAIRGAEFLLKSPDPENFFTPEDYTEEQQMLRSTVRAFLDKEIEPIKEKFDSKEGISLAPALLEKMGELGFHGIGVPEEYGGMNCDMKTELAYGEIASDCFAFAQSVGVHTGLGIYPVLLYGTDAQKQKYLTDIVSAKIKCSYCLTEPGAGSDANSAKSKAVTTEDGKHYLLNGQKMWITNSGFADVFFVFCKIDGDENLSCLIVHKEYGVKLGPEENKLGIHGSSTRQVFFENVLVPVENLLGERNKGFKIAMNALNAGRIKIAVANTAISKRALKIAIGYAGERVQFGQSLSSFGAIQHKIGSMATKIYALESSWNRTGQQIDETYAEMVQSGMSSLEAKVKAVAEFAMECAMEKVYGSEVEQYVVDECLQIHGGMGYSAESEISVHYRNIRGNRIYEGTNEINRMLTPTTMIRKAMKGEIDLMSAAMNAFQQLTTGALKPAEGSDTATLSKNFLQNAKTAAILLSGLAVQTHQEKIQHEQEVLMNLADILTQVYVLECAMARTQKHHNHGSAEVRNRMVEVLMHEAAAAIINSAREVVFACSSGDQATGTIKSISRMLQLPHQNLKDTRRQIAAYFIEQKEYRLA